MPALRTMPIRSSRRIRRLRQASLTIVTRVAADDVIPDECLQVRLDSLRHIAPLDQQAQLHVLRQGVLGEIRARYKEAENVPFAVEVRRRPIADDYAVTTIAVSSVGVNGMGRSRSLSMATRSLARSW